MTLTSPSNQASSSFLINLIEDSLIFCLQFDIVVVLKKKNGRDSDIFQIDKLASVASAANLPNFNFNFQQIIKTRTALHPLDWIKVKSGYYHHLHDHLPHIHLHHHHVYCKVSIFIVIIVFN